MLGQIVHLILLYRGNVLLDQGSLLHLHKAVRLGYMAYYLSGLHRLTRGVEIERVRAQVVHMGVKLVYGTLYLIRVRGEVVCHPVLLLEVNPVYGVQDRFAELHDCEGSYKI